MRNPIRELAYRACDGLEVALLWRPADDRLTVSVADTKTGAAFELPARRDKALDVFYHPFAYATGAPAAALAARP